MKELIKKIKVNEDLSKIKLEWLVEGEDHALHPEGNSELIRYLLVKVLNLEEQIEQLTKAQP